ncbi:MAG: hypothetical protein LBQ54_01100 [Planctomycetaceae bacterium]|nr:hypothetical protein [Planctomycetaceae bacterium]
MPPAGNARALHPGWDCRPEPITRSHCSLGSVPLHRTSQAVGKDILPESEPNEVSVSLLGSNALALASGLPGCGAACHAAGTTPLEDKRQNHVIGIKT